MKKEAVQDERKRPVNEDEFENPLDEMPVIDILEAEKEYNNNEEVITIVYFYNHSRRFLGEWGSACLSNYVEPVQTIRIKLIVIIKTRGSTSASMFYI